MTKNNLFILGAKIGVSLLLYYTFIAENWFSMITPTIALVTIAFIQYSNRNKENQQ